MPVKKPVAVRQYNFSDATLEQLSDVTASNITRDLAQLAARGITAATVTALEALRDTFSDAPTDVEARGVVTDAVEVKDAARAAALTEARRLRTAAQNVYGENVGKYNRFGFEGMDNLDDNEVPRALRRMYRVGSALMAELAGEGIDAAFFTSFGNAVLAFDDQLDNVDRAEEERDMMTEDRINKGNILYKEIVRLCNIGKDVFAPISEALYNDYVIENFTGTGGEPILGTVQDTVAASATKNASPVLAGMQKIRMTTVANGPLEFAMSNDGSTPVGNTTTMGAPATTTYTLADFGVTGAFIIVINQNPTDTGEYKIEFLG